jgi:phosphatidylserine/phosphatidylglycerophosphate/cardiolipin synthase-like enzyme
MSNIAPFTTARPPIERIQRYYRAPGHDIKTPLLALAAQAQRTIDIEIYGFALPCLVDALIAAKNRGVRVRILFDRVQAGGPGERDLVREIADAGIEHWIGSSPDRQIRHSKVMIVDGEWAEMGSLNYSESAFKQNNTVIIMRDAEIAADLTADWEENKAWLLANEPQYQAAAQPDRSPG